MEKLLKLGVLPIVNENDTVSTAELEYMAKGPERIFGDNDRLAALVMIAPPICRRRRLSRSFKHRRIRDER